MKFKPIIILKTKSLEEIRQNYSTTKVCSLSLVQNI